MVAVKKLTSLAGLLAAAVLLLLSAIWVVIANPLLQVGACTTASKTVSGLTSGAFVAAGVVAFVLGNLLGHWRDFSDELNEHEPPERSQLPAGERRANELHRRRARNVQALLAGTLTLVSLLLAYETWAVWSGAPWFAITDFIRCASAAATPQVWVASTALLFLAGHWLWHPLGTRRP